MVNTEKPMSKEESKRQTSGIGNKSQNLTKNQPLTKDQKEEVKELTEKKVEKKVDKKVEKKVKRDKASVNATSLPISTKYSVAICKFVKNKKIERAIGELEQVIIKKKAVPMKGEIPHRKGKIMSGRFPKKASEYFIVLLKSLLSNANNNEMDEPIISEAIANLASRPFGKFGRVRKKRTHVKLTVIEKSKFKKLNKKKGKIKWKKEIVLN